MIGKDPFPPLVPRWKSIQRALKFALNPIPILDKNIEEYGDTYAFHIGGFFSKGIVTTEPEIIRHVLQKNHRNYRKSNIQTKILARFLGNGLLTSEGDYWLRQRRLIQPGFHRDRIKGLINLMNSEIHDSLAQLESQIQLNPVVDVHGEMNRLAFRIIAKAIFSTSLNEADLQALSERITVLQKFIVRQIRQPYMRPWHHLSGQVRRHEKISDRTKEILARLIAQRKNSQLQEDDLLQMLLDARYEDTGERMTDEQTLDEALVLFIAGHETSANALAWILYLLAQYDNITDKLRKEISRVVGDNSPTYDHIKELQYTRQVIEEGMRLYPPAWIIDRVSLDDDVIKGYHFAKGTLMILYVYGAHRSDKLWNYPNRFDPGRFHQDHTKSIQPFSYFPFGGGPRLCIGNNFAMMEMQLTLVHFLRKFDLERIPGDDVSPLPMVTLRPKAGIPIKLSRLRESRVRHS